MCNEEPPDAALDTFMKLLSPVTNEHTTIKKMTVTMVKSPWIDEEFKTCIVERYEDKGMANKSGSPTDWQTYSKLRNHVTKLKKMKEKLYYETKINYIKNDSKKALEHHWRQKLHHSLNQMAHLSQNPLILQTTLITFSLAR